MDDSTLHLLQGLGFFAGVVLVVWGTRPFWGPRLKAYYAKRPPMLQYWKQGIGKLIFAIKSDEFDESGRRVFQLEGWSHDSANSRFSITFGGLWNQAVYEEDSRFKIGVGVAMFCRTGKSSDHFVRELDRRIFCSHLGAKGMRAEPVPFTALVLGGNPSDLGNRMTVTLALDTGQEQGTILADLKFDLANARVEFCERSAANRETLVRTIGDLD
jgi:hypothetical protein